MSPVRLLLTGFEPFGGEIVNPSMEVVRAIAAEPRSDIEVTSMILPVRGRISFGRLLPALEDGAFDAWLGLGEAGGRPQLSVERIGVNLLIEPPLREEETLVEGGPAAYFSRLPVRALAEAITRSGVPAQVSNSAGTYICNEATYVVQHHLATRGLDMPSGFIHLPFLPEQAIGKPAATPSMALETQVRGVRAALECIAELVASRAGAASTAR